MTTASFTNMDGHEHVRNVRLSGKLGAKFGRVHRLAVASTAEAVRALCVMLPGFERELMTSRERGVVYACFLGKKNIGQDGLHLPGGLSDIRISPRIAGAKAGGVLQTIVGAVLVVVGYLGETIGQAYGGAAWGPALIHMGGAMMIGGVLQMLVPQQTSTSTKDTDNGASYNFNGPVNTTAQGNPVPVLYGRMVVGSAVISAGILAQDKAYVGAVTTPTTPQKVLDAFFGN